MASLLVLGMAVVDFVFAVDTLPDRPQKYRADRADIVGGGPAASAAVAISRLGGHAALAARLGRDALADLILADLKAEGVSTDLVHRGPGGQSSFSSVYVDAGGERQIVNFRGAGLIEETGWLRDATPADAVLVDPRWPGGAEVALDLAHDWGVPGILDGEAPIAQALLQKASHVAFSRTGLQSLTDLTDPAQALADMARRLPGWACVTDGAGGVYHTEASGIAHTAAFQVDARDTTGAGDVWHGAFALALAEGQDEASAIRFANAAAAIKCTRFGGRSGCPDRAAVSAFLKERP
ncbi:MAG: PfkB family carbohydrate kinase [Rhodobacter sp.]|nr:PfkB family carbohydrate kinase [Rhodobacter sp.]